DVRRRDFTINGLLLDPLKAFPHELKPLSFEGGNVRAEACTLREKATADPSTAPLLKDASGSAQDDKALEGRAGLRAAVLDYVGGLADLDAGVVRAIG